jgi:general secretion pathway protein G
MVGIGAVVLLVGGRERARAGVRLTRATLGVVHTALAAYRADHEGRCPPTLLALKTDGYLGVDPVDAWGRPLRFQCPGRRSSGGYDLMSDGPDGDIGGLDRVE